MKSLNDGSELIEELLQKILRVVSLGVIQDKSLTESARLLKLAGLDNKTIADVLGTGVPTIRTVTSNLHREIAASRKRRKKS